MFTITTVQLRVSAINVGHLQVVHEEPYDKLYLHVIGGTVCGVGWVRDLVLCLQEGCGSGLFKGVVKISFMSTINYIGYIFDDVLSYIGNYEYINMDCV